MIKALPVALLALVILGCDGTLVFNHPTFIPSHRDKLISSFTAEITPQQVRLGETLTLRVSRLSEDVVTHAYLMAADQSSGADFEDPEQKPGVSPAFRLGRLKPVNGVATLSFEVRSRMGNNQFGAPFTLEASQSGTIVITQEDAYGGIGTMSSSHLNFSILPNP